MTPSLIDHIVDEQTTPSGARTIEFTLDRGDRPITGVLWLPADATTGTALVCCGHGASGDRHQPPIPWLAKRLTADHGVAVLSIDGPVHGRRQGGNGGRDAFWPEWRRPGSAEDMVADWTLALDAARQIPELADGRVGYWGLSMGTIYGAPFVAAEPRISVAVLGLMGITGPDTYRPVIEAAAANITIPVSFLMQLEDELFSRAECLALFDALATQDKRLHANPGLHPAVPMEELVHSVSFLVEHLTGEAPVRTTAFIVSE